MIYPERESKVLEFKEALPQNKQIIKTCVAFANGSGGEIIIGVADKTREIIGVSKKTREIIFESLNNSIFDSISPQVIPDIFEQNFNDKVLVIIKIYPGNKPPYFIKKEGSKKGVYLRVGASSRRATDDYIEELYRNQKKIYFDEQLTDKNLNDLDKVLLEKIYGKHYSSNNLIADKVIARDPINPENLYATHTGVLFFYEKPELYIPEASIICTQFSGISGRNITQTRELKGPIPVLANSALQLMANWTEKNLMVYQSGKMKGQYPIPLIALREAIINALIHRKYFISGSIKIALYDDHIEIHSPGEFPGLVNINNLGDGTTFLRNPSIARLARKSKLVEKLGSGIKLIFDECKKAKLKKPVFNEDGDFVKVTFFFEKEIDQSQSEENQIIQLGKNKKIITIKDLTNLLNISRNTATRKINSLIEKGIFQRRGKGPATYFILQDHIYESMD